MFMTTHCRLLLGAAIVLFSGACFGQTEIQMRARHLPGWDPRAREGHCTVRVWVDNRAEVRMRGDGIYVKTLEGARAHDEGSECSQPIPYNYVRGFQVRQIAGRSPVTLAQEPSRANNYTATIVIEDRQGGGDNYAFDVSWRAEGNDVVNAPAPFFDEVRACQDLVRQTFLSRNRRGAYIDFENFADRQIQGQSPGNGKGYAKGRNRDQEFIQGRGSARSASQSRDITYSCVFNTRLQQMVSGDYRYSNDGYRTDQRMILK